MMRRGRSSSQVMKYRGVIFDFNGVLLCDAGFQIEAWQQVAGQLRGRAMSAEELALHMHGRPNSSVLSYLTGRRIAGSEVRTLSQAKGALSWRLCPQKRDRPHI